MDAGLGYVLVVEAVLVVDTVPLAVTSLKGKHVMVVAGLLFLPCWWIGAIRLARPNSWWARRYYRGDKETRAWLRYASAGAELVPRHGISD